VLDLGCGSGEFLAMATERGAQASGTDAAERMVQIARLRLPDADLRVGPIEALPWPGGTFDVVTAFNSVQFSADRRTTLREARRVVRPNGVVAVCAWGASRECDVDSVDVALGALGADAPPARGPRLGEHGILEALMSSAGLAVVSAQDVSVPFAVADEAGLQRAFALDALLSGARERVGEAAVREAIARAAAPFRRPDGSYRFENVFRVVISRPEA
jgi:SAM-dependent methyltransferase